MSGPQSLCALEGLFFCMVGAIDLFLFAGATPPSQTFPIRQTGSRGKIVSSMSHRGTKPQTHVF